ncbi:MAG TPA: hypothetical protein VK922_12295 [Gemmatimonadaceae bacterium]|nr:hypothetical protein [Gemmatimonadaceae bacterium]
MAELADGTPTAEESAHLAACAECARERRAHEQVLELARITGEHALPPLTSFEVLAEQLRLEGRVSSGEPVPRRGFASAWWMRAAAAVLLVVSGVAVGRWTADVAPAVPLAQAEADSLDVPAFASPDDARATLVRAERDYRGALAWLAQYDGGVTQLESPEAYRARLAVLDELAGTARRGVDEAPYDPMLSQYYLSTLAARQATLQRLDGVLPSGVRLTQF